MTAPGDAAAVLADWRFVDAPRLLRRRRRPAASAGEALRLAARELRLVLTVLFVIFVTSESWQVFGRLGGARYLVLLAGFAVLAGLLGAMSGVFTARDVIAREGESRRAVPAGARTVLVRRLRRRAWFETLVVGVTVAGGFFALGVLVVDDTLTREWAALDGRSFTSVPLSELWRDRVQGPVELYRLPGSTLVVSEPLLRVVGVLGAFAALLFAVEVLVDPDMRHDVLDDLLVDWEAARAAWDERPAEECTAPGQTGATTVP